MGRTRRVAERMILERSDRARRIGAELRAIASRLEGGKPAASSGETLRREAASLRAMADQVERL